MNVHQRTLSPCAHLDEQQLWQGVTGRSHNDGIHLQQQLAKL